MPHLLVSFVGFTIYVDVALGRIQTHNPALHGHYQYITIIVFGHLFSSFESPHLAINQSMHVDWSYPGSFLLKLYPLCIFSFCYVIDYIVHYFLEILMKDLICTFLFTCLPFVLICSGVYYLLGMLAEFL